MKPLMTPEFMKKLAIILMAANVAGMIWALIMWKAGRL
jgi:hypothetical protein